MEEKISVVIPVYKVEKHLPRCLRSIEEQTVFSALDVILVDDGSPDASGAICDEFVARHANARVIHKQNGGVSSARNAGLDAATGEYTAFVDSDDFLRRDALEVALRHMAAGEQAVFFRTVDVFDNGEVALPDAPQDIYLQGPEDAPLVVGVELFRPLGVHPPELVIEGCDALGRRPGLELFPPAAGEGGKLPSGDQVVDIQPRAPYQDGQPAPGQDVLHTGGGVGYIPGHGVVLGRVRHVQHVVGDPPHLRRGGLGGADVHAAVDLHGVGGDHLAPGEKGQLHAQGRFARGRGAADHDYFIRHTITACRLEWDRMAPRRAVPFQSDNPL